MIFKKELKFYDLPSFVYFKPINDRNDIENFLMTFIFKFWVFFQWHFETQHASHSEIIMDHNRNIEGKMLPLTREIIDSQVR
jgi:hypothetical protein